jgi:hypothetical protein
MKLTEYFRFSEGSDLPEGFGREPCEMCEALRTNRVFLMMEDSRGNIKKFLKMSDKLADHFHNLSTKFSFALAKAFLIWLDSEEVVGWQPNAAGHGGMDADAITRKKGDKDAVMKDPPEKVLQNYDREVGGPLLKLLDDKPHYEKQVNAAKTYEDIQKIFTAYKKKKITTSNKILIKFPNGWFWYGPLDPDECGPGNTQGTEAQLMQHCGADHRGDLVSLRDENNYPYVTMTYNFGTNKVFQIKGRQNRAPEERYHPYIIDFWKKYGPKLKDKEITRATPKLANALNELTPPDKTMEEKLKHLEPLLSDPDIRAYPYDLDLIVHGVYTYGEDEIDIEAVKKWYGDHGMKPMTLKLTGKEHTVWFDPTLWTDDTSIVPNYNQLGAWNAWMVANIAKAGLNNHEIAKDPIAWVAERADKLQRIYTELHQALGIPNKKPISVKALSKPKMNVQIDPTDYADWFGHTRPGTKNSWISLPEFFKAHPEVKRGIEKHIDRYSGYGGVEARYRALMADAANVSEDSLGRYFFETHSGLKVLMKPREAQDGLYYYFMKAGTQEQIFGEQ